MNAAPAMQAAHIERFLSPSARSATRNEIRELLKLVSRPEVISLAGGLPSPETFPIADLQRLLPAMLERHGASALQYGPTEGDAGLRARLIQHLTQLEGEPFSRLTPEHVLITSASQQALDLCGRVFITPGDVVMCELPTYLGALGAFTACGARMSGVPLDEEGIRTDLLEQRLVDLRRRGVRPKLLYTVPDFHNPSGVTQSLRRREDLLSIAREFDLLVVEDSPYRQLRYVGESVPSLASLDRDGRTIALFSFSKILAPGLRLGYVVAEEEIISRLVVAKQAMDLCTSGLSQLVAREFLEAGLLPAQIERIRKIYAAKREALLGALERRIDPAWGVRWTRPQGGLFLWMTLPPWMDAAELFTLAIEEHVAFVTGSAFHCDRSGHNTLRINFSYPGVDQLDVAAERLARSIGRMLDRPHRREVPRDAASAEETLVRATHSLERLAWNLALSEVVE